MKLPSRSLEWLTLLVAVVAVVVAILVVPPASLEANITAWVGQLPSYLLSTFLLLTCLILLLWYLRYRSTGIREISTRQKWWNENIAQVIETADSIVLIDSYQGHKHELWDALEKRLLKPEPFRLTYAMLKHEDVFLERILGIIDVDAAILKADLGLLRGLHLTRSRSPYSSNKHLRLLYWKGICSGPLLSWTIEGKERIGVGFWLHLKEMTDLTPYLIVTRGPLFDALRRHYHKVLENAEEIPAADLEAA